MATKKVEKQVDFTPIELKDHLHYIIENNKYLQERRLPLISVGISGISGLGKTSIVEQVAVERDINYVKLNLAQIGEEVSELVGYPIRQFEMKPLDVSVSESKDAIWVDEVVTDSFKNKGYEFTGRNQTGYCPATWIANIDLSKGGIFLLDDFTRGSVRTLQAVMEIIDRQTYISWKLPKGWTVVLTENPADQDYLVNELDDAQKSRYMGVNLKFDKECWMQFAEETGVDSRAINFLGLHPELVTKECNPRSITRFFNSIASIKDFKSQLPRIQSLGEGSVGLEFSSMFVLFINNRLDLLVSPKTMVEGKDWSKVKKEMIDCIGEGKDYRADIASVLGTRIINHSQLLAKEGTVSKDVSERLIKLVTEGVLQDDICFHITKKLINGEGKEKFVQMLTNKKVVEMSVK